MNRNESNVFHKSFLPDLLLWIDSNPEVLLHRSRLASGGKPSGIWTGFSTFQSPVTLLQYAGNPAMHLALLLYVQGAGVSYRSSETGADVSFLATIKRKAEVSGLSPRAVRSGFKRLEKDGSISLRMSGKTDAGRFRARRVFLLNPQTGERLSTDPGHYGLLSSNASDEHFHFVTVPRVALEAIHTMKHASEKAVYLAALCLVSKARDESVFVERSLWRQLSYLGENAFNRGVRYCIGRKLLSYRKHILTVNDPQTSKPTERWKNKGVRIDHENTHWKFDLNTVTPEEWHGVVQKAMQQTISFFDGWRTVKELGCPYCGEQGKFSLSFSDSGFRCHACQQGHGKLGQLVQHVRGTNMDAAKVFIQETIEQNRQEIAA